MSSSRTEALVDVTMPQMGVSVAEGTRRRVAQAGGRLGASATRSSPRSRRTRSTRTWSRRPRAGWRRSWWRWARRWRSATVLARIASERRAGRPRAGAARRRRGRRSPIDEAGAALPRPATRASCRATPPRTTRRRPGGRRAPAGQPPLLARRGAHGGRARPRPRADRRAPAAAGGCASRTCSRTWSARTAPAEPPMHIESPYKPDAPRRRRASAPPRLRPPEPAAGTALGRRHLGAAVAHARARSAAPWSSRCGRRRPARRSSRPT